MNTNWLKRIGLIILFVAIGAFYPLVVMLLWNWLMPAIFGLGTISFWQAFGLAFLIGLLFRVGVNCKVKKED